MKPWRLCSPVALLVLCLACSASRVELNRSFAATLALADHSAADNDPALRYDRGMYLIERDFPHWAIEDFRYAVTHNYPEGRDDRFPKRELGIALLTEAERLKRSSAMSDGDGAFQAQWEALVQESREWLSRSLQDVPGDVRAKEFYQRASALAQGRSRAPGQ